MPSQEASPYHVEPVGPAKEQMRRLIQKGASLNRKQEVVDALNVIIRRLRTQPLEWGDPEYRTRHPGGMVVRGAKDPVFVRYAVYEDEKAVLLLKVQAMPRSFLD
jgi:hypothetical protein